MLYRYQASNKSGRIEEGDYDAPDKKTVVTYLQEKGLIPVSVEEKTVAISKMNLSSNLFEKVTPLDQVALVRNLSAALHAGLGIIEALNILIADADKDIMRKLLTKARDNLQNGQSLSATFSEMKEVFPPIFVGMIKAGEVGGKLDAVFDDLGKQLSRDYDLSKKVKAAMAYPVILICAAVLVVGLLLFFVLPRLTVAFAQAGYQLPWITLFIIFLSHIVLYSPALDIIAILFVAWFFVYFRKTVMGQKLFTAVGMHTPIIKGLMKKIALVRFTRTLGNLISSGMPIIEALNLSADSVSNVYYREAVTDVIVQVKNGVPLNMALASHGKLFPQFLTSLINVGERSGSLEKVLSTFSEFYDEEVADSLKDVTAFIEPILILFMGLTVGGIAVAVLLPIYSLIGKIQ
jgi:type II secretory pathway component PulF